MGKYYSLFIACFLCIMAQGQKLPVLLSKGDAPAFSYMECLNALPKKSDRYCSRYDYIYKLEGDTLYITEVWNYKVDQEKKTKVHYTYYRAHINLLALMKSINEVSNAREVDRIKNMEGDKQSMCPYTLYSHPENMILEKKMVGGQYVTTSISSIRLYAHDRYDVKELLNYLMTR